jgi:DNA replication protein DnaC
MDTNQKSEASDSSPSKSLFSRAQPQPLTSEEREAMNQRAAKLERERIEFDRRQAVHSLSSDIGPRYSRERVSLDSFTLYHQSQREVVERLRAVSAEIPERTKNGSGLVFLGTVGTGKDHLMAAMLYIAAGQFGIHPRWVNGQEIYGRFRDSMDTGRREEDILAELSKPEILAISDPIPAVGEPTAWNITQLYRLLDRRYRHMKPTWASLNALSIQDADEKLSAPVFDRLRDSAEFFKCFWPSYRERAK